MDESEPAGDGFLASVVVGWEEQARAAEELGLRVVTTRSGVVLSDQGGALAKMLPFFKAGVGGPVAGGRQFFPWIHVEDAAAALIFLLERDEASGPVNLSRPRPSRTRSSRRRSAVCSTAPRSRPFRRWR